MLVIRKKNIQARLIRLMWKSCFCSTRCVVPLGSRLLGEGFRGADHDYIACITTFSIILLTTFNFYSKLDIQINRQEFFKESVIKEKSLLSWGCHSVWVELPCSIWPCLSCGEERCDMLQVVEWLIHSYAINDDSLLLCSKMWCFIS